MDKMKLLIIIVSVAALISAVVVCVWYYKTKFYIPDKDGMIYSYSDTDNQGDD